MSSVKKTAEEVMLVLSSSKAFGRHVAPFLVPRSPSAPDHGWTEELDQELETGSCLEESSPRMSSEILMVTFKVTNISDVLIISIRVTKLQDVLLYFTASSICFLRECV